MVFDSLRVRFLLWSWVVLIGALGASFWCASDAVDSQLIRETEQRAAAHLETIHWMMDQVPEFESQQSFDAWTQELGNRLDVRITFIDQGKVLADSLVPFGRLSSLDDHSKRPEVLAALKGETGLNRRPSPTFDREMIYAARMVPSTAGLPAGVLRVAVPLNAIEKRAMVFRSSFLAIFGLALAASLLASLLLSRRLSRSVSVFSDMARDIGKGEFSRRLGPYPGGEFRGLAETINQMAENIEKHVRIVESQRGQLAAILESMSDGVMMLDGQGRVEVYNEALRGMFPNVAELQGKTPVEALRDLEVQHAAEHLLQDGRDGRLTLRIKTPNGRPLEVEAASIVAPSESDPMARQLIFVFRDLSQAKKNERILKDFLTNASHQLKTPLTGVRGYAETLLDAPPDDPVLARGFLQRILENAQLMSRLINGLLELAKSERPRPRNTIEAVDAARMVEDVVDSLSYLIESRQLKVVNNVEAGLSVMATDSDLELVMTNVLENAVKHSPDGGCITIKSRRENGKSAITVADEGPGVAASIRERIFEPFFRADPNPVDEEQGCGLGLAISRKTLEQLGGEIFLSPDAGDAAGAAFVIKLRAAS